LQTNESERACTQSIYSNRLLSELDKDLGVTLDPFVDSVVGTSSIGMRWLTIWLGFARPFPIRSRRYSLYFFARRLAAAHDNAPVEETSNGKLEDSILGFLALCPRIRRDVHPNKFNVAMCIRFYRMKEFEPRTLRATRLELRLALWESPNGALDVGYRFTSIWFRT
jgi:hypothetical protein